MTKIIRRTTPAFRAINRQGPTLAQVSPRWPTTKELGADYHWLLGSDNPTDTCGITGKRLHPNLRSYLTDGGTGWTVAPTVTFPSGGVGSAILSGSTASVPSKVSGGTGYTSAPTVSVSATLAAGGRLPRYNALVGSGEVTALIPLDNGFGLLTDPVISFTGGGGTGANWTANLPRSVKTATLLTPGSGYTGAPTINASGTARGRAPRFIPIMSGATVSGIACLDGGEDLLGAWTLTFTGGGGAVQATGSITLGTNCISALEITDCGNQVGSVAATLTGGDGSGASGGALISSGTYTRSAGFLTIPAGGTTDTAAQNGMLTPVLDTGEFTEIVVLKKSGSGLSQIVMGTANNGGSGYGGFNLQYTNASGYQVQDFNLQTTLSTLTVPGVAGDWIILVLGISPVAGESVTPSATPVQSHKLYARAGNQTALSVLTGERKTLVKRRLLGVGNTGQVSVNFRDSQSVAEVLVYKRLLSAAEIDAVVTRITARQALRGNTVVN